MIHMLLCGVQGMMLLVRCYIKRATCLFSCSRTLCLRTLTAFAPQAERCDDVQNSLEKFKGSRHDYLTFKSYHNFMETGMSRRGGNDLLHTAHQLQCSSVSSLICFCCQLCLIILIVLLDITHSAQMY